MTNLALGHALSCRDLFVNFKSNKVDLKDKTCYDWHTKRAAANIFSKCFEIVIQDIIDNNVQFKLPPYGNGSSYIQMKQYRGSEFKRLFKAGKWRDVDFLATNFTGYQLAFYIKNQKRMDKEKPIHISPKMREQITEKINQGFTY